MGVVESLRPSLVPRNTTHQALVTAGCAATMAVVAGPSRGWSRRAGYVVLPLAVAVGAWRADTHVRAQRRSFPAWDPRPQNSALAVAAGTLGAMALVGAPRGYLRGSRWAGAAVARVSGGSPARWSTAVGAAVGMSLATAASIGARSALSGLREVGTGPDFALMKRPDDPYVTGGPGSLVDYDTLARDGRRFVTFRTPADQIRNVDGRAMEPVRVYIGLHSADTVEQRVDLAIAELERLGGFDRSNLLIMSPAGSGYAEYVAAEAVECFSRGDCASVVVQYGVLPSMLSLRRVGLGARTVRTLLDRVHQRLRELDRAPKVYMYGESLGARVAQEALQREPSRIRGTGQVTGLDALVSVGTPGGPSLRNELLHCPAVVHLDRWQQMAPDRTGQLWFLDHDADPVTRWDGALAWRRPDWLRAPRGRNIPGGMAWMPLLTWWQVIFDLVFAAQQQSGEFRSRGHDYRADLAPVLAAVVGHGAEVDAVAELLAEREVERDTLLQETTASSLPH